MRAELINTNFKNYGLDNSQNIHLKQLKAYGLNKNI